jgi:hypothetical protein
MYSYFYSLIQKIILKKNFYVDLIQLINKHKVNEIIDIGCADSLILEHFNDEYLYYGYDLNSYFTNKSKSKYKNNNKLQFYNKGVDEIDFRKFDPDKSIIVLAGLLHHINDSQVKKFVDRTKNFKIITFDAVKLAGQKSITKLLMSLDRGNHIRHLDNYKKLLSDFDFFIAKNKYLRFPYDHLISTKNIDKNIINDVFN